jgi:hypothetical protein
VAPNIEEPAEVTMSGSAPIARQAESTARFKPGSEPVMPTATRSPSRTPARSIIWVTAAAKLGWAARLFEAWAPRSVVSSVNSGPTTPLSAGSLRGSTLTPRSRLAARIVRSADSISSTARSLVRHASACPGRSERSATA